MTRNETLLLFELGVLSCGILLLLVSFTALPIHFPNADTARFILNHYIGSVSLGAILVCLLTAFRVSCEQLFDLAILFISISLICFAHFNFKLLAMLINQANFDFFYWQIDQWLIAHIGIGEKLYAQLGLFECAEMGWYQDIFVATFYISFLLAVKDGWLFECSIGVSIILIVGGAFYALFPAWGPFIFEQQLASYSTQRVMQVFYRDFILTRGEAYDPGKFIAAVAAMPSLHVAHSTFLGLMVWKRSIAWRWLFVVLCGYLAWSAIVLKWHYSLDIIVGVVLSALTWWLVKDIAITGLSRLRYRLRIMSMSVVIVLVSLYWFNGYQLKAG